MIMIQTLISKYEKIKSNTEKKEEVYNQILKELNSLEKVYIILSNQDDTSKYRKPFVADKDGKPVIFLFTEYEHALNWVNHYEGFKYKNTPLIGELYRAQNEFNSIFQICDYMGIKEILLNEGLCLFFISPVKMIDVNNFSHEIKLRLSPEEIDEIKRKNLEPQMQLPTLRIINYGYNDLIKDERVDEMMQAVLNGNESVFFETTAVEDIFTAEMVKENFIKQALEMENMQDVEYFKGIINSLIFKALKKMKDYSNIWYVRDSLEDAPIKRDGSIILCCNEYFSDRILAPIKNAGINCDLDKLTPIQFYKFIEILNENGDEMIILTDGRYEIKVPVNNVYEMLQKLINIPDSEEIIIRLRNMIIAGDKEAFEDTTMSEDILAMNLVVDEFITGAVESEEDESVVDNYEEFLYSICQKLTEKILKNERVWYINNKEMDVPILKNGGVVIAVTDENKDILLEPVLSEGFDAELKELNLEDFYKLVYVSSDKEDECSIIVLTDGIIEFVIEPEAYLKLLNNYFEINY